MKQSRLSYHFGVALWNFAIAEWEDQQEKIQIQLPYQLTRSNYVNR